MSIRCPAATCTIARFVSFRFPKPRAVRLRLPSRFMVLTLNTFTPNTFSTAPAIVPDLVLAIGLLTTFSTISMSLNLSTVIISHTVFCTAFVVAIVLARIGLMDPSIEEASTDLGAGAFKTLFKVTIPQLMPALIAGAVLSFTLSMDEFVIAFFTNGPETPTLPMVIYSMIRFGVTPEINVLGTLLLVISFVGVIFAQRIGKVADSI